VQRGQEVIPAGRRLRPQEIGVLASLGITTISVDPTTTRGYPRHRRRVNPRRPAADAGENSQQQRLYASGAGRAVGGIPVPLGIARDNEADVRDKLQRGLDAGVDLFISSAGVSVGAYDVVKAVLEKEGVVGFWRVRMRPGKPLAFGTYKGIPYLGLPGNPVSAMVSFERFARAAIRKMGGFTALERPQRQVIMQESVDSDGRESYLRAVVTADGERWTAVTTGGQGSHMMTSLVQANALVIVPEGVTHVPVGTELTAWMLDWPEWIF
jgi:molybdopterin molybdotransferase